MHGPSQTETCTGSQRACLHTARPARPPARRRPGRASRHGPPPPRGPPARPAAPAGSRPPARCRRRRADRSTRRRPAAARPRPAPGWPHDAACRAPGAATRGCAPVRATKRAPVLGHRGRIVADRQPRFRLSQGAWLTPPVRVLISAPTRSATVPLRPQQQSGERGQPLQNASGQASGRVFSNASSFMQASKTRITCGTWSARHSKRWALKICGTSTQSASVGVSPWQ